MKRRRGYFKHYNDASQGDSLRTLARRKEYLAIALYWHFLELCNQKDCSEIELDSESLRHQYCCQDSTLARSLAALQSAVGDFRASLNAGKILLEISNYSEYQDLRSTNNPRKGQSSKTIKDKREKIKIKDKTKGKDTPPHSGITAENLANLWNELVGSKLPNVLALNPNRKKKIMARLKENSDAQYWEQVIKKILASDFLTGKNDRNWVADFDFLLKPDTHVKIIEGKYDNRKSRGAGYSI